MQNVGDTDLRFFAVFNGDEATISKWSDAKPLIMPA